MAPWLAQIAGFLLARFANVFPNLVGVFSAIVSALPKEEAAALYKAIKSFHDRIAGGASWEDAATATLNVLEGAEYAILSDAAKHLVQAFIHKAKPAAAA
jgi:cytochrome c1